MTTIAIAYCRVSTSKQDLSMDQQQAACAAWCTARGYVLAHTLVDSDVSGAMPLLERPNGRLLLPVAQQQSATVLVSTYVDRLFRDTLDGLRCMREAFPAAGLSVMLVNEALDLSTAMGRMSAGIRLLTAEFERELIGDRTRRTSQRLQDDGRVYGHVPYGCVAMEGALFRHPPTWAQRERIVTALRNEPLREVQAWLRRTRVRAPNGGMGWALNTLSNLLKTHERLSRLPISGDEYAEADLTPLDTEVSA